MDLRARATREIREYIAVIYNRNVALLLLSFPLIVAPMGFLSWYSPVFTDELFHSWAPLLYALFLLDDALFLSISGVLSDMWGRRIILVIGMLFYPLGMFLVLLGLTLGNSILIALGLILALGISSLASPAGTSLLMESLEVERRARALSLFFLIENIFLLTGSSLFGLLLPALGVHQVFLIFFLLSAVAVLIRAQVRETLVLSDKIKLRDRIAELRSIISILKDARVKLLIAFDALLGISHGTIAFVVPLFFAHDIHLSEVEIGFLYGLIPALRIFLSPIAGTISEHHMHASIAIGTTITGLLYLSLLAPLGKLSAIIGITGSALTLFEGIAYSKLVSTIVQGRGMASLYGFTGTVFSLGMGLGSYLLGSTYYWRSWFPIAIASFLLIFSPILIPRSKENSDNSSL